MGMASYIKKGESVLIPFRNGMSISDSQLKPRMYKTMQAFERSFPGHYLGKDGVELVEYAEVVHSRFVRIADFGDGEGCFGYCEKCGTVHHAQSPVALKADHRWCRWCGAKMDGDWNG